MSTVTRPRGPLPARVYWTRRVLVVLLAFALVFGIARLLGGSGSAPSGAAAPVGSTPTPTTSPSLATSAAVQPTPSSSVAATAGPQGGKKAASTLAMPTGPCDDADVRVTPDIRDAQEGGPITIVLKLTTAEAAACTWQVSPETVFLTIERKGREVWTSQQCPDVITTQDVVPRKEHADKVRLTWSSQESDEGCTSAPPYVTKGVYTATAVARGSVVPVELRFSVVPAARRTRTITPTPTPTPTPSPSAEQGAGQGTGQGGAGQGGAGQGAGSGKTKKQG